MTNEMKYRAFNKITGLFYSRKTSAFTAECQYDGGILDSAQLAVVRATFDNVGEVSSRYGIEWPECGCDRCEARANLP